MVSEYSGLLTLSVSHCLPLLTLTACCACIFHCNLRCCSTILPTITSLLGFIIVKYTTSQNPNYSPLTLSLNQNNPDIAKDRNPIPANFPGWYQCQPGRCVYEAVISDSSILLHDTSEQYYYCGSNVKVSNDDNMCSIQSSAEVINQIIQYGAFIVGNEVSDVSDVSKHDQFFVCMLI